MRLLATGDLSVKVQTAGREVHQGISREEFANSRRASENLIGVQEVEVARFSSIQ